MKNIVKKNSQYEDKNEMEDIDRMHEREIDELHSPESFKHTFFNTINGRG